MENDIYRRLQKHLDRHPIAFPATETGSEIRLLKSLFNVQEAIIALQLSTLPEKVKKIHKRLDRMPLDALEKYLAYKLSVPIAKNRQLKADLWNEYLASLDEMSPTEGLQGRNRTIRASRIVNVRAR